MGFGPWPGEAPADRSRCGQRKNPQQAAARLLDRRSLAVEIEQHTQPAKHGREDEDEQDASGMTQTI